MLRFVLLIYLKNGCAAIHGDAERTSSHTNFRAAEEGAKNSSSFRHDSSPTETDSLTCMRNTGGSCVVFGCSSNRGPTVCEAGRCVCARGLCANTEGACQRGQGKWLGSHSIRFAHPYDQSRPFIGVAPAKSAWIVNTQTTLASTPNSEPAWKIALTPGGFVRFQSLSMPDHAMKMYNNRRRRTDDFLVERKSATLKKAANVTASAGDESDQKQKSQKQKGALPDDDDIWPIVVPISTASPLDVTFQVRPTHKDGGGLEIWDPQTKHVLASGNPEWWAKDHVAANGIAECSEGFFWSSECEGRQLVQFEPALPIEATPFVARSRVQGISVLNWWQTILVFVAVCGCCALCFMGQMAMSDY